MGSVMIDEIAVWVYRDFCVVPRYSGSGEKFFVLDTRRQVLGREFDVYYRDNFLFTLDSKDEAIKWAEGFISQCGIYSKGGVKWI